MVHEHGPHLYFADVELHVAQFLNGDVARQFFQSDWKEGAFHLRAKRGGETLTRAFVTKNADIVLGIVGRDKKWKSLNVIPMGVREQQR